MNFSTALKVFQLNILRQAGVAVTPQQVGLKSDPIADLQAKNANSGMFGNILNQLGASGAQGMAAPTPPKPPADATDAAAQTKYQQDLMAYQHHFQLYNQRFMQMLLSQFQSLQQSISASQKQQNSSASGSSSASEEPIGVGGILGD